MKRNNFFWGSMVLVAGVLLLLKTLGLFTFNFWPVFWAVMLILAGVWFLLGPRLFKADMIEEQVTIPLEGASEADIRFNHGAGRILINSGNLGGNLLSGTFTGGLEKEISRSGSSLSANLSMPQRVLGVAIPGVDFKGFAWNLTLNRDVPLRLRFSKGAGESVLDLSDTLVKELRVETGASATRVKLPMRAGQTRVTAKAGMASLEFSVPQGVSARIRLDTGMSSNKIDTNRFPLTGSVYQSPDFDTAANRVDIEIEAGMGGIDVR